MAAPTYNVGDIVYLKESAAIGHIEPVKISGIQSTAIGSWVYSVHFSTRNPQSPHHFGDRVSLVNNQTAFYTEAEFVTHCEALEIAEANAQVLLDKLQALRAAICGITDGTA